MTTVSMDEAETNVSLRGLHVFTAPVLLYGVIEKKQPKILPRNLSYVARWHKTATDPGAILQLSFNNLDLAGRNVPPQVTLLAVVCEGLVTGQDFRPVSASALTIPVQSAAATRDLSSPTSSPPPPLAAADRHMVQHEDDGPEGQQRRRMAGEQSHEPLSAGMALRLPSRPLRRPTLMLLTSGCFPDMGGLVPPGCKRRMLTTDLDSSGPLLGLLPDPSPVWAALVPLDHMLSTGSPGGSGGAGGATSTGYGVTCSSSREPLKQGVYDSSIGDGEGDVASRCVSLPVCLRPGCLGRSRVRKTSGDGRTLAVTLLHLDFDNLLHKGPGGQHPQSEDQRQRADVHAAGVRLTPVSSNGCRDAGMAVREYKYGECTPDGGAASGQLSARYGGSPNKRRAVAGGGGSSAVQSLTALSLEDTAGECGGSGAAAAAAGSDPAAASGDDGVAVPRLCALRMTLGVRVSDAVASLATASSIARNVPDMAAVQDPAPRDASLDGSSLQSQSATVVEFQYVFDFAAPCQDDVIGLTPIHNMDADGNYTRDIQRAVQRMPPQQQQQQQQHRSQEQQHQEPTSALHHPNPHPQWGQQEDARPPDLDTVVADVRRSLRRASSGTLGLSGDVLDDGGGGLGVGTSPGPTMRVGLTIGAHRDPAAEAAVDAADANSLRGRYFAERLIAGPGGVFRCPMCPVRCRGVEGLMQHLYASHSLYQYTCLEPPDEAAAITTGNRLDEAVTSQTDPSSATPKRYIVQVQLPPDIVDVAHQHLEWPEEDKLVIERPGGRKECAFRSFMFARAWRMITWAFTDVQAIHRSHDGCSQLQQQQHSTRAPLRLPAAAATPPSALQARSDITAAAADGGALSLSDPDVVMEEAVETARAQDDACGVACHAEPGHWAGTVGVDQAKVDYERPGSSAIVSAGGAGGVGVSDGLWEDGQPCRRLSADRPMGQSPPLEAAPAVMEMDMGGNRNGEGADGGLEGLVGACECRWGVAGDGCGTSGPGPSEADANVVVGRRLLTEVPLVHALPQKQHQTSAAGLVGGNGNNGSTGMGVGRRHSGPLPAALTSTGVRHSGRRYYHSRSATEASVEEMFGPHDSSDETDDEEFAEGFDRHLSEATRLQSLRPDAHRFFKLWATFARRRPILADYITPRRCLEFCREHAHLLRSDAGLRRQLVVHLMLLHEMNLVDPRVMHRCMLIVDSRLAVGTEDDEAFLTSGVSAAAPRATTGASGGHDGSGVAAGSGCDDNGDRQRRGVSIVVGNRGAGASSMGHEDDVAARHAFGKVYDAGVAAHGTGGLPMTAAAAEAVAAMTGHHLRQGLLPFPIMHGEKSRARSQPGYSASFEQATGEAAATAVEVEPMAAEPQVSIDRLGAAAAGTAAAQLAVGTRPLNPAGGLTATLERQPSPLTALSTGTVDMEGQFPTAVVNAALSSVPDASWKEQEDGGEEQVQKARSAPSKSWLLKKRARWASKPPPAPLQLTSRPLGGPQRGSADASVVAGAGLKLPVVAWGRGKGDGLAGQAPAPVGGKGSQQARELSPTHWEERQ